MCFLAQSRMEVPKELLKANCHCKTVQLTFPTPQKALTECHCSICHRYGVLWSAFPPEEVKIEGKTEFYVWGDKNIQFHRCKSCGCVTHWEPVDKVHKIISVNCRMLEREDLERFEVRRSKGPTKD